MASQSLSMGAYASAVIKNGLKSKTTEKSKTISQFDLTPKSIIKAGSNFFHYFGTVGEYAKLNEIDPGDFYTDGIYAVEYNPENNHFFRVMAVYFHKEDKKYYYLPSSFSYLSILDPTNKLHMPITIINGPIEVLMLSMSECKKICPDLLD